MKKGKDIIGLRTRLLQESRADLRVSVYFEICLGASRVESGYDMCADINIYAKHVAGLFCFISLCYTYSGIAFGLDFRKWNMQEFVYIVRNIIYPASLSSTFYLIHHSY